MGKRKYIVGIAVVIILLVTGIACIKKFSPPSDPPVIRITAEGRELSYTVGKNEWNGNKYDRMDVLMEILASSDSNAIGSVSEDETVEIEFSGKSPTSYTLTKEVFVNDSDVKVPIEFQNGKGSFIHSTSELNNLDEATMIGYRLICRWGKNECEYGFIIR